MIFAARCWYQQDDVHKEVVHDINQLQDGLDITRETDVSPNQNDNQIQETAKCRDEDEANKQ